MKLVKIKVIKIINKTNKFIKFKRNIGEKNVFNVIINIIGNFWGFKSRPRSKRLCSMYCYY